LVGDGAVLEDIYAKCDRHAKFLVAHFPKEDPDDLKWSETPFYAWMTNRHSVRGQSL
jgi:hypothetical protein